MLNQVKDIAAKQVGKLLSSEATMKVLSSPQLQQAVVTAINLRAEAREALEKRVKDLAKSIDLVTRDDVAKLRRNVRDLEDHLSELREQLEQAQAELAARHAEESAATTAAPTSAKAARPRKAKT